ncbi:MAG: PAS domain-containing protein [Litoreibacter sp.]
MDYSTTDSFCEALVKLHAPFCEVVVHDLATETVAKVFATKTDRVVGEPSYLDELPAMDLNQKSYGPYRRTGTNGKALKSISIVGRNRKGEPEHLICINIDVTQYETIQAAVSMVLAVPDDEKSTPLANDWLERLHGFTGEYAAALGVLPRDLSAQERKALVGKLSNMNVFEQKNAAQAVAKALGVSRATIYQDLKSQL